MTKVTLLNNKYMLMDLLTISLATLPIKAFSCSILLKQPHRFVLKMGSVQYIVMGEALSVKFSTSLELFEQNPSRATLSL